MAILQRWVIMRRNGMNRKYLCMIRELKSRWVRGPSLRRRRESTRKDWIKASR